MTSEDRANEWVPRSTATDTDSADTEDGPAGTDSDAAAEVPSGPHRSGAGTAGFAMGRALVVLGAAAIVYFNVVPTHHIERSRLSLLVIGKPGAATYQKAQPQSGQQDDTQTGLTALTAAAKKYPNQTGLYSVEWAASQTSAAGLVAFLMPNGSSAASLTSQLQSQQLAPNANKANSMTRSSTFALPGVPGSAGSVFTPTAKNQPTLVSVLYRVGNVVVLTQVIGPSSSAKPDSVTVALNEYAKVRQVAPGFTLSVTRYPMAPTIGLAAGAVVLAALVAVTPPLWRRRAERRRLAYEEELASRVIVGGKVIVKHRR
jgi:hypothetical protein